MAQVERLAHARGAVGEDADVAVDHLVAVAHRAVAQRADAQRRRQVGNVRLDVARAGGQQHERRAGTAVVPASDETSLVAPVTLDRAHSSGGEADAVRLGVLAHVAHQACAVDPVGKAGHVVRTCYPRSPAVAFVDNQHAAPEARQVERAGQAGRTAADDEGVEIP